MRNFIREHINKVEEDLQTRLGFVFPACELVESLGIHLGGGRTADHSLEISFPIVQAHAAIAWLFWLGREVGVDVLSLHVAPYFGLRFVLIASQDGKGQRSPPLPAAGGA